MITNINEFKTVNEFKNSIDIEISISNIMDYYKNKINEIDALIDSEYSKREDEKNKYVAILKYLTLAYNEI